MTKAIALTSGTKSKRGRKPEHHRRPDGSYVQGLARRPSDGRWRIIGTDITFTEPDESLAVHRFKMWEAQQKKSVLKVGRTVDDANDAELEARMLEQAQIPGRI